MLSRRRPRAIPLLLMASVAALPSAGQKERAKIDPELEPAFGLAMAAPAEIGASALLRLAPRVADRDLRRDFIGMAFQLAAQAHHRVRLLAVPPEPDTRAATTSAALQLDMDRLSLESHAAVAMLDVDPGRARELFGQVARPALAPAACGDTLVPDVSPYYEALTAVALGAFPPKERSSAAYAVFVNSGLGRMSVLADVGPAAQALSSVELPRQAFEAALASFLARLDALPHDSRSFFYFVHPIDKAITDLVARTRRGGSDASGLVEGYRKFLVTNFRAPQCLEAERVTGQFLENSGMMQLFGPAMRGDQPALSVEEMTPESLEGEMNVDHYWQSGESQEVYQQLLRLREGPAAGMSPEARKSAEWREQFTSFLAVFAGWNASSESSAADYFHEAAGVYQILLETAPPGELSARVLAGFLALLKSSSLAGEDPVEWFWPARSVLAQVKPHDPEQAGKILAAYRSSGNIALMLEAALDQIAPANPPAPAPVH